jgi:hypothetical protein
MEGQGIGEAYAEERKHLGFMVGASTAPDEREMWTCVDVSRDAMERLERGAVADETRLALRTQGTGISRDGRQARR